MSPIRLLLFCILCAGCSSPEIGTVPKNADRDKAQKYFQALGNVKTADEEEKLLTEFGEWLKKKGYRIRVVEEKNGRHFLSCPYFPSLTPWAIHSFLDVKNLKLLPSIDNGG